MGRILAAALTAMTASVARSGRYRRINELPLPTMAGLQTSGRSKAEAVPWARPGALALGVLLTLVAWPSAAFAPLIAMLAKQMVQQAVTSMIKDTLLNSLSGMGCKGIALSNAINALDSASPGLGGLPGMNMAGMTMPTLPKLPGGMQMPTLPGGGMPGMPGMDATMLAGLPPGMAAKMQAMLPAGLSLDAKQMAMMQDVQTAMAHPLSPPETVATIDELAELGFLPPAIQTEMKECMVLVPQSGPALGMSMGMLKPMVPQLRQARDQMRALSPAEQDELADAMVHELGAVSADDRKGIVEALDSGFFPSQVSESVKTRLDGK